jgi:hypothetical protein
MLKPSIRFTLLCLNLLGVISLRAEIVTVDFLGTIRTGTSPINTGDPYTLKIQYDTNVTPIGNDDYPLVTTDFTTPNYFGSTQSGMLLIQNGNGHIGSVGGQDQFNLDGYASGAYPQIAPGYVFKTLILQLDDWNGSMFDSGLPPTEIRTNAWNPYFFARLTWWTQAGDWHYVDLEVPTSIQVIPEPATSALIAASLPLLFFIRRRANRR